MWNNKKEREFIVVYEEYADGVFRHCFFRVSNRDRAQELMQETFMRTWEYVTRGKEIQNIKAFLYRVANNLIIEEYRKKKESSLDDLKEKGFDIKGSGEGEVHVKLDYNRALKMLKKIDKIYREPVFMRYVDELSPKEIAKILHLDENVISVRIHRGLKQLNALFGEHK